MSQRRGSVRSQTQRHPQRRQHRQREPERHQPLGGEPARRDAQRHADDRAGEPGHQEPAREAAHLQRADGRQRQASPTARTGDVLPEPELVGLVQRRRRDRRAAGTRPSTCRRTAAGVRSPWTADPRPRPRRRRRARPGTRPASERHPCSGSRIQATAADTSRIERAHEEELGMGESSAAQQQACADRASTAATRQAPRRPRRRGARRRGSRGSRPPGAPRTCRRATPPAATAGRPPCERPRTSAIAGGPDRCPRTRTAVLPTPGRAPCAAAPATVGINAGVPGRAPDEREPSAAPTRAHQRYTGSSGPTPNGQR